MACFSLKGFKVLRVLQRLRMAPAKLMSTQGPRLPLPICGRPHLLQVSSNCHTMNFGLTKRGHMQYSLKKHWYLGVPIMHSARHVPKRSEWQDAYKLSGTRRNDSRLGVQHQVTEVSCRSAIVHCGMMNAMSSRRKDMSEYTAFGKLATCSAAAFTWCDLGMSNVSSFPGP
jgi:hypothetical protein